MRFFISEADYNAWSDNGKMNAIAGIHKTVIEELIRVAKDESTKAFLGGYVAGFDRCQLLHLSEYERDGK